MDDYLALRVKMAYRCIEIFREWLKPEEWERCVAGEDDPDSFCDSNEAVASAFEDVFGYDSASSFGTSREPEVFSHWNAAVRLASRLMVGETFSEQEAAEVVAENDSKGLAIVGGGRNLQEVAREFGLIR